MGPLGWGEWKNGRRGALRNLWTWVFPANWSKPFFLNAFSACVLEQYVKESKTWELSDINQIVAFKSVVSIKAQLLWSISTTLNQYSSLAIRTSFEFSRCLLSIAISMFSIAGLTVDAYCHWIFLLRRALFVPLLVLALSQYLYSVFTRLHRERLPCMIEWECS